MRIINMWKGNTKKCYKIVLFTFERENWGFCCYSLTIFNILIQFGNTREDEDEDKYTIENTRKVK